MLRGYLSVAVAILTVAIPSQFALLAQNFDKPEPTPVTGGIDWVYDYETGKEKSLETGKPMFVVFRCER